MCSCTNLEPEWSFKSVNINQKGGVLFRSEGILAVVKLGPEVVTRVFLDNDRLSVPLGFYKQTHIRTVNTKTELSQTHYSPISSYVVQIQTYFFSLLYSSKQPLNNSL